MVQPMGRTRRRGLRRGCNEPVELLGQRPRRRGTPFRYLLKAPQDQGLNFRRDVNLRILFGKEGRGLREVAKKHLVLPTRKGEVPCQKLVENHTNRVDVAGGFHGLDFAPDLFRAHVRGGAQRLAELGKLVAGVTGIEDLGDAEVEDLESLLAGRRAILKHQVLGLEVSVDDVHVMRDLERIAELPQHVIDPGKRHGYLGLEPLIEALASDEFHLDESLSLGQDIGVMNGDDVGVGEPRHRLSLPAKSPPPFRVAGDSGGDGFQGSLGFELQVPNQVDLPHAPRAQLAEHQVLVEKDAAAAGRERRAGLGAQPRLTLRNDRAGAVRSGIGVRWRDRSGCFLTRFRSRKGGALIPLEGPKGYVVRRMFAGTADHCRDSWWSSSVECDRVSLDRRNIEVGNAWRYAKAAR